jgi:WD40 repeat protein
MTNDQPLFSVTDPGSMFIEHIGFSANDTEIVLVVSNTPDIASLGYTTWAVDITSGKIIRRYLDELHQLPLFSYCSSKQCIAFGGYRPQITIVDAQSGNVLAPLPSGGETVTALKFSKDGSLLAVGTETQNHIPGQNPLTLPPTHRIQLFNVDDWSVLHTSEGMSANGFDFNADCTLLAIAGSRSSVCPIASLDNPIWLHDSRSDCIALSPDASRVAFFFGLYNVDSGTSLWDDEETDIPFDQPSSLKFSPNGKWIVGGGKSDGIRIWDGFTAEVIKESVTDVYPYQIALSNDGSKLAYSDSDSLWVMEISSILGSEYLSA